MRESESSVEWAERSARSITTTVGGMLVDLEDDGIDWHVSVREDATWSLLFAGRAKTRDLTAAKRIALAIATALAGVTT